MSTCYIFSLTFGFGFDAGELFRQLGKPCAEKSHLEPRYNPKTGKKDYDEKVVDVPAGLVVEIGGKTFIMADGDDGPEWDELEGLVAAISKQVKCPVDISSTQTTNFVVFEAPGRRRSGKLAVDFGHIEVGGPLSLDSVTADAKKLPKVAAGLRKLGLKVGKPKIHIAYCVG